MASTSCGLSRRALLASGAAVAVGQLAACGIGSPGREQRPSTQFRDVEIVWHKQQLGEPRDSAMVETANLIRELTGIKITFLIEQFAVAWPKRQAELAAGQTNADIFDNAQHFVIPGGLLGMFADHNEYVRRDKMDTKQFYPDLEHWAWKGKLWGLPNQSGGEACFFNKTLFDQRGTKYPDRNWTYDDLLDKARRLTDAPNSKFGVEVGQNGIHYMMGTFILNFGGKRLNDAKDRALYGDDGNAIRGAEFDIDLHVKHRVTPTAEARRALPTGVPAQPMEVGMVAMEFNGFFRSQTIRPAIGVQNLDFAPPPKGPTGIQTATAAGNAWSVMALSKQKDAAWTALKTLYLKEVMLGPYFRFPGWPPVKWAATSDKWMEQFKGTHIADCMKVWETAGHDILPLPEGAEARTVMNTPMNRALVGEISTREAMQDSARALNELFSRRPPAWR